MAITSTAAVTVLLTEGDRRAALVADVRDGLSGSRRSLPSKWLYDERGCELFDAITELDEYYPTRAERAALAGHADDIARAAHAGTLIELGSGTSTKTRLLIEGCIREGGLRRFVAFDVAETTLRETVRVLAVDYPCVEISGVVGDFERHLGQLPDLPDRLVAFLGGTIGNLEPDARAAFLAELAGVLRPGEGLLLGADLVKDTGRLVAAYDDREGTTEAFEKNVLGVVNRELGADFDPARFAYHASWSEVEERIEMGLVSRGDQQVHIPGVGLAVDLVDGEEIRTEVSAKFRADRLEAELAEAGFVPAGRWSDPDGDYAILLARRAGPR